MRNAACACRTLIETHTEHHVERCVCEDRSVVYRNRLLLIRAHGTKARFRFDEYVCECVLDTLITTTVRHRIRRTLFHIYFIFSFNSSIHFRIESKWKIEFHVVRSLRGFNFNITMWRHNRTILFSCFFIRIWLVVHWCVYMGESLAQQTCSHWVM